MIEKRSGFVYAVVVAAAVPSRLARLFIHSFIPLLHSLGFPPFFLLFSSLSSVTCPTIQSIHLKLHVHVHTPYDTKKGFRASYITYVLYCT